MFCEVIQTDSLDNETNFPTLHLLQQRSGIIQHNAARSHQQFPAWFQTNFLRGVFVDIFDGCIIANLKLKGGSIQAFDLQRLSFPTCFRRGRGGWRTSRPRFFQVFSITKNIPKMIKKDQFHWDAIYNMIIYSYIILYTHMNPESLSLSASSK